MALAMATPAYQEDLAAARAEFAMLRAQPHVRPAPEQCAEETRLIAMP
jgi:hypothetical protein